MTTNEKDSGAKGSGGVGVTIDPAELAKIREQFKRYGEAFRAKTDAKRRRAAAKVPRHVAIHEAAHAVAWVRVGGGLGKHAHLTIIKDNEDGTDGALGVSRSMHQLEDPKVWRKEIVPLLAGYAAECRVVRGSARARIGAATDFAMAKMAIRLAKTRRPFATWLALAKTFVAKPRNWRSIEKLADRLQTEGTLDGAAVTALVKERTR